MKMAKASAAPSAPPKLSVSQFSIVPDSDGQNGVPPDMLSDNPSDAPSDIPSDAPSTTPSCYGKAGKKGKAGMLVSMSSDMPSDVPSSIPSDVPTTTTSCYDGKSGKGGKAGKGGKSAKKKMMEKEKSGNFATNTDIVMNFAASTSNCIPLRKIYVPFFLAILGVFFYY